MLRLKRAWRVARIWDEGLFERLFKRIVGRIKDAWKYGVVDPVPSGTWLSKLRAFNPTIFDSRLKLSLRQWLSDSRDGTFFYECILPAVVGSECISIADFVRSFEEFVPQLDANGAGFESRLLFVKNILPGEEAEGIVSDGVSGTKNV